jgi:hypothetical protein
MKFVFNRARTVSSKYGHVIFFDKGVPTHVPPEMYQEVLAVGGNPESEIDLDPPKPDGPEEPTDPVAREAALFSAFESLSLRGKREDFTAGGQPHQKALAKELGWEVSSKERDLMWVKFKTQTEE